MESLDRAFENVCELDLIFHFDEVGADGLVRCHPAEENANRSITSFQRSCKEV